ncbi:longevity-assurance protein [Xylariaceae sp. FL0255]|nr:longevity-assurance protein [Xylariaceae sp. FL0255]
MAARKLKVKTAGPRQRGLAGWLFDNQISVSFTLIGSLITAYNFLPPLQPYTSKFLTLSGFNAETGKYAIGKEDLCFVAFCILVLTGLRATAMKYVLSPLARRWGIQKQGVVNRFSEQAWMIAYNAVFWSLGMHIYTQSSYCLSLEKLWADWPQRELDGLTKFYLLVQWSYWTQGILVANLEARRHDFWQIITHHIVTISLIGGAYGNYQYKVSNLILVLMDSIELIFPVAKCLKYLGFTTITDVIFGLFMVTWLFTRHIFYMMICWSVYFDSKRVMPSACWKGTATILEGPLTVPNNSWTYFLEPYRNPAGLVCMSDGLRVGFLAYLLALQGVMLVWSAAIVRVAIRVLRGDGADDVRSEDEDEDEEEEIEEYDEQEWLVNEKSAQVFEEEVGVEAIDFDVWKRRTGMKETGSRSSGVRVSRHSDRKELLNRIGCEKQID